MREGGGAWLRVLLCAAFVFIVVQEVRIRSIYASPAAPALRRALAGNYATRADMLRSVAEIRSQRASSLAYVVERMGDLESSIFKMNMDYEGFEDKVKALLHTLRSYKADTKEQVEQVSKKVAGLGTLLSRVPQLLEKVESDNRETVEGVTKKISSLEQLIMHPGSSAPDASPSYALSPPAAPGSSTSSKALRDAKAAVQGAKITQGVVGGSKISEIGTANVLSVAATPKKEGTVDDSDLKPLPKQPPSASDLPQTPRQDSADEGELSQRPLDEMDNKPANAGTDDDTRRQSGKSPSSTRKGGGADDASEDSAQEKAEATCTRNPRSQCVEALFQAALCW